MITTNSLRGRVALMVGHCAGMVDLVALPVWVGTLISVYRFDPQQAGLLRDGGFGRRIRHLVVLEGGRAD